MVFFRAGAMALLEEERDNIVLTLVRKLQGEILKRFKTREFCKRRDQRELVRVCQRQFRKFTALRDWGWFIILQKTRPLINLSNPEEELRLLEEKAKLTYDVYMEKLETKKKLEEENREMEEENKTLLHQIEKEQGSLGQYHERQAAVAKEKLDLEQELLEKQKKLASLEARRGKAAASKKSMEQENATVKREIQNLEIVVTKLEQEKSSKDHTINTLNDEIENKDVTINKVSYKLECKDILLANQFFKQSHELFFCVSPVSVFAQPGNRTHCTNDGHLREQLPCELSKRNCKLFYNHNYHIEIF